MKYSDGSYYEGEWKNNMYDGFGEFVWTNGDKYSGFWKEDMRHGEAIMTMDGDKYNG